MWVHIYWARPQNRFAYFKHHYKWDKDLGTLGSQSSIASIAAERWALRGSGWLSFFSKEVRSLKSMRPLPSLAHPCLSESAALCTLERLEQPHTLVQSQHPPAMHARILIGYYGPAASFMCKAG